MVEGWGLCGWHCRCFGAGDLEGVFAALCHCSVPEQLRCLLLQFLGPRNVETRSTIRLCSTAMGSMCKTGMLADARCWTLQERCCSLSDLGCVDDLLLLRRCKTGMDSRHPAAPLSAVHCLLRRCPLFDAAYLKRNFSGKHWVCLAGCA